MNTLKKYLLLLAFVAMSNRMSADNDFLQYQYDAAGNRISRAVVQPSPRQNPKRDLPIENVTVSPTVTTDVVTIATAVDFEKEPMRYTLISMQGNMLDQGKICSHQTNISLGVYTKGIYLLTVESDTFVKTYKIFKK